MTPKKRRNKSRSKKRRRSKTKRDGDDDSKKIELKQELLISRLKKIIKNVNEMETKIKKYEKKSPKKHKERKILINKRLKSPGKSKVKFDVSMLTPNYNVANTSKYNYLGSNNHNMNRNQQGYNQQPDNQQPDNQQPFIGEGGGGGGGEGGGRINNTIYAFKGAPTSAIKGKGLGYRINTPISKLIDTLEDEGKKMEERVTQLIPFLNEFIQSNKGVDTNQQKLDELKIIIRDYLKDPGSEEQSPTKSELTSSSSSSVSSSPSKNESSSVNSNESSPSKNELSPSKNESSYANSNET